MASLLADPSREDVEHTFVGQAIESIDVMPTDGGKPPVVLLGLHPNGRAGAPPIVQMRRQLPVDDEALEAFLAADRIPGLRVVCETAHAGVATALEVVQDPQRTQRLLFSGSDRGKIAIFSVDVGEDGSGAMTDITSKQYFRTGANPSICGSPITRLAASDSRAHLASLGDDGTLHLLELETMKEMKCNEVDPLAVHDICWRTGGVEVFTAGAMAGEQLKLWDCRSPLRDPALTLGTTAGQIGTLMFSYTAVSAHPTDAMQVACGTSEGEVLVWDLRRDKDKPVQTFASHAGEVRQVLSHPKDGCCLLSGGAMDGRCVLNIIGNDPASDSPVCEDVCETAQGFVGLAFDPESNYLVSAFHNESVITYKDHPYLNRGRYW